MDLKKPIGFIVVCFMIFSFFSIAFVSTQGQSGEEDVESSSDESLLGYTSHAPIRIDGNDEFANSTAVSNNGAAGNETDPYIIEGWDVDGSGHGYGIYIGNTTDHFVVRDCYLHNASKDYNSTYFYDAGLHLFDVQNSTIYNNTVMNNKRGIYAYSSKDTVILSNNASGNSYGIQINNGSYGNTIEGNYVSDNNDTGILLQSSDNNMISNNAAISNSDGGVILSSSNENTLEDNNASQNHRGIGLYYSSKNKINGNTAFNNSEGIRIYDSKNNTFTNNVAFKNSQGFEVYSSSNNAISKNIFTGNSDGVPIYFSAYNTFTDNKISNNNNGVYMHSSSRNSLVGNNISMNSNYGFYMNNAFCYNNTFYHNSFIDNTDQANDLCTNNSWNASYPTGGNYWSDYSGVDDYSGPDQTQSNSDGIGDTNYSISGVTAVDEYPLMEPIVEDQKQSAPIRINNNTDLNETAQSGNGTEADPYIIEGYDIDGGGYGYGIYIGNTTDHFVVRDCYLHNASGSSSWPYFSSSGLTINNVTNGAIENNLICNNTRVGIYMRYSSDNTIHKNNLLNNRGGLSLYFSSENNTVHDNNCSYNSMDGFQIYYSDSNSIYNNVASKNGGNGFYVISKNSTIEGNQIRNNREKAIKCWGSINCSIDNNILTNNTEGIYLDESKETNIFNNMISNSSYGIKMDYSSKIQAVNNTIHSSNNSLWTIKMDRFSEDIKIQKNVLTSNTSTNYYEHRWDEGLVAPYDDPTGISNLSDYMEYLANASYTEFINISANTTFEYHIMGWEDAPDLDLGIYYDNNSDNKAQTEELVEFCADVDADEIVTLEYTKPGTYIAKVAGYEVDGSEGHFNRSLTLGNVAIRILGRDHTLSDNTISGYGGGIVADGIVQSILDRNTISSGNTSIHLSNVNDGLITRNYLSNNSVAINIKNSTDNELYYNNFMNNSKHIHSLDNTSYSNTWDDDEGKGNYWDDYSGTDDGSAGRTAGDGVGDTEIPHPYMDKGGGYFQLDNNPLMEPADISPPIIYDVDVQNITETTVNVTWKTNEPATSMVVYSTNPNLSSNLNSTNKTMVENHSVLLTDLSIGTKYYFEVKSEDSYNIVTDDNESDYYSFETLDLTSPVITSVSIIHLNATSATITWTTDEPSDSRVNYSVNPDLSSNQTVFNNAQTTSHSVELNGLSEDTRYFFEVFSTDDAGNRAKDDNNSEYYRFNTTLSDTTPPNIADATTGTPTTGEQFTLKANVTDNEGVDSVKIVYWFSGREEQDTLSKGGENWTVTIEIQDNATDLHYRFNASDVNGNWANSEEYTLQVEDNDAPTIADMTPKTATTGDPFVFNLTMIDNIKVTNAYVIYWFGSDRANSTNKSLNNVMGSTWTLEITIRSNTIYDLNYDVSATDGENWARLQDVYTSIYDNDPPNAEAGEDVEIYMGTRVEFNASSSTDNTGIWEYRWTSEDISNFSLEGKTSSYKFDGPGTYNITLTVTDLGGNTDSDELNVTVSTTRDTDGDGVPDEEDPDDDGDGMPDDWEEQHGFDPKNKYDAFYDEDNDNLTNVEEYNKGTDPNNPDTDGDGILDGEDPLPTESGIGDGDDEDTEFPWWVFVIVAAISALVVFFVLKKYTGSSEEEVETEESMDEYKEIQEEPESEPDQVESEP